MIALRTFFLAGLLACALAPAVRAQTVVNAASFETLRPLAPGGVAALFGSFPGVTEAQAQTSQLPIALGGAGIAVEGVDAGLYAVTPTQINFQVPVELEAGRDGESFRVEIFIQGELAGQTALVARRISPVIFLLDAGAPLRPAAALNQDHTLNSEQNPARPGEALQLFLTGGGAAPPAAVQVFVRTRAGETLFSGPAPGLPGLWQINVRIPEDAELPEGPAPVTVLAGGVSSNTASVWIGR